MMKENLTRAQMLELTRRCAKYRYEWFHVITEPRGKFSVYYSRKMWNKEIERLHKFGLKAIAAEKRRERRKLKSE